MWIKIEDKYINVNQICGFIWVDEYETFDFIDRQLNSHYRTIEAHLAITMSSGDTITIDESDGGKKIYNKLVKMIKEK